MRRLLALATLPLDAAAGAARFARDVGTIAAVAREVEPELRGEAATARRRMGEALDLVSENNELTRETNALMSRVDVDAVKLLAVLAALQRDMPTLTDSAETISDAVPTLSDAMPPVQAAAERVERIAGRIPRLRDR